MVGKSDKYSDSRVPTAEDPRSERIYRDTDRLRLFSEGSELWDSRGLAPLTGSPSLTENRSLNTSHDDTEHLGVISEYDFEGCDPPKRKHTKRTLISRRHSVYGQQVNVGHRHTADRDGIEPQPFKIEIEELPL